ncbi:MAG: hypothetical protein AAGF15_09040, partial [Pseudomonadota bacterium]
MPWQNNQDGGPWSGGGGSGGPKGPPKNPWGNGSGGGGGPRRPNQPPNFDDLIRKGQEKLRGGLPGGLGGGKALLVFILVALGLWFASGLYTVK